MRKPPRLFFWIILGMLSTFFAEVLSGSDLFPFFHWWRLLVTTPLYTLHILVLSYVVFRFSKPRIYTLFLAGTLFGMYEAYITKVLWNPPWGAFLHLGGIAVFASIVLVLFWHAFMSYVIPLIFAENALTSSTETFSGLPKKVLNKRTPFILAALFGAFQFSQSTAMSLLSGMANIGVLILLIFTYRKFTKGHQYDMRDLLPTKRQFAVLLSLLLLLYITTGLILRPEALPGIFPQAVIWMIYSALFTLFYFSLKRSKTTETEPVEIGFSWNNLILLSIVYLISLGIFSTTKGIGSMIVVWGAGSVFGIAMLVFSLKDAFR